MKNIIMDETEFMDCTEKKKVFIKFLKKHKAYIPFRVNLAKSMNDFFEFREDSTILNSFLWVNTEEGYSYWSDLEKEWAKHVSEK